MKPLRIPAPKRPGESTFIVMCETLALIDLAEAGALDMLLPDNSRATFVVPDLLMVELRSLGTPIASQVIGWLKNHCIEIIAAEMHAEYLQLLAYKPTVKSNKYVTMATEEMLSDCLGLGTEGITHRGVEYVPGNHAIVVLRDEAAKNMPFLARASSYISFATVSDVIRRTSAS